MNILIDILDTSKEMNTLLKELKQGEITHEEYKDRLDTLALANNIQILSMLAQTPFE